MIYLICGGTQACGWSQLFQSIDHLLSPEFLASREDKSEADPSLTPFWMCTKLAQDLLGLKNCVIEAEVALRFLP